MAQPTSPTPPPSIYIIIILILRWRRLRYRDAKVLHDTHRNKTRDNDCDQPSINNYHHQDRRNYFSIIIFDGKCYIVHDSTIDTIYTNHPSPPTLDSLYSPLRGHCWDRWSCDKISATFCIRHWLRCNPSSNTFPLGPRPVTRERNGTKNYHFIFSQVNLAVPHLRLTMNITI